MGIAKALMQEHFTDSEGNYPEDFGMCPFCGFVGLNFYYSDKGKKICPKCKKENTFMPSKEEQEKYLDKLEGFPVPFEFIPDYIKTQISQMWVAKELRKQGFLVMKTGYYDYFTNKEILNEKGLDYFLNDYKNKRKILKELKEFDSGYPDLMLLKDGVISFVEVKTNKSEARENQIKVAKYLKDKGYKVSIYRVNASYNVEDLGFEEFKS